MGKGNSMNGLLGRNRPEEGERKRRSPSLPPPAAWVDKFKTWLPQFLCKKCLNEGEWYPLSSLKDDFRASCGMEIDYVSLGYFKLSDFIQSLPGLCRVKIVGIGRGLATHIVLLPTDLNHHSFAKKGRSYTDAAAKWVSDPIEENPLTPVPPPSSQYVPRSKRQVAPPIHQCSPPPSSSPASGQADHCFLSFLQVETSFFTPWTLYKPSYREEIQFSTPTNGSTFWERKPKSVLSPCSPPPHSVSQMRLVESNNSKSKRNSTGNGGVCKAV